MMPVYVVLGIVVLILMAVILVLLYLLVKQQEQAHKVQDDLNNRLMTHTWEDYVVNRRAEAADKGPRKADWKPGDDKKPAFNPSPDYHPELGGIR